MMDRTNELLEELLAMIARSNKILMMVNIVNIATIITIITVPVATKRHHVLETIKEYHQILVIVDKLLIHWQI